MMMQPRSYAAAVASHHANVVATTAAVTAPLPPHPNNHHPQPQLFSYYPQTTGYGNALNAPQMMGQSTTTVYYKQPYTEPVVVFSQQAQQLQSTNTTPLPISQEAFPPLQTTSSPTNNNAKPGFAAAFTTTYKHAVSDDLTTTTPLNNQTSTALERMAGLSSNDSTPHQRHASPPPPILAVLADLLECHVAMEERKWGLFPGNFRSTGRPSLFHGEATPGISIAKYLERIFLYANCSFSCFVLAYVYIDRFIEMNPNVPITSICVHRLLITAVLVATKFLDDIYYTNSYYAQVGGVPTAELNELELELLKRLDFRLHVSPEQLEAYYQRLEHALAMAKTQPLKAPFSFAHAAVQTDPVPVVAAPPPPRSKPASVGNGMVFVGAC